MNGQRMRYAVSNQYEYPLGQYLLTSAISIEIEVAFGVRSTTYTVID